LRSPDQNSSLIFLWHHPVNAEIADQLAEVLICRGFETISMNMANAMDESSFASDWEMSKADSIIFLISSTAVQSPNLQIEAEKVLRRKGVLLLPVLLDDLNNKDLPLILQYLSPIKLFRDYAKAVEDLTAEIKMANGAHRSTYRVWQKPFRWIIEHYRRYLTLSPLTFTWQITVENLLVSLAVSGLILLIWQPPPRTNLENITASTYLWMIIFLGPIVETIFLQAIPVFLARVLGFRFIGQMVSSIVLFAALHFTRSISAGIGAGMIGGFYSAFTYIHWRSKSSWTAIWVTAFSHCLYNLALFAMLIGEF
jgi:hypothetical protein